MEFIDGIEEEKTNISVVIRSSKEVTVGSFQSYIVHNYEQLENSNILILGGIHGTAEGKIETDDERYGNTGCGVFKRGVQN